MDYRIIWGTNDDRPPTDAVGSGRGAIEALLERAGAKVVWAEVFDDHRRPVAHKSPGRQGLRGFPSAAGWGHVCTACRTLSGQTYLFARAHPGLRLPRDEGGGHESVCRNCGSGMGMEDASRTAPPVWTILRWPDMKS